MSVPTLVAASAFHAEACAAIHGAAFPEGEAWSAADFASLLASPGVHGLLADTGGLVLVRHAADEAEILTLATAPPSRRQGVARALLAEALDAIRDRGAARAFLEVSAENAAARSLYEKAGFTPCGRRRGYYPNGVDAIVLRRDLVQSKNAAC